MSAKLRTTMKLLGHHLVIQTSDQQVTTPALIMEQREIPNSCAAITRESDLACQPLILYCTRPDNDNYYAASIHLMTAILRYQ